MINKISSEKIIKVVSGFFQTNDIEFIIDKEIEKIINGMASVYSKRVVEHPNILKDFAEEIRDLVNANDKEAQVLNVSAEKAVPPKEYHLKLFKVLKGYYEGHI